jgi:hypothetical protein
MTVGELVEWLQTQDQEYDVKILSVSSGRVEWIDFVPRYTGLAYHKLDADTLGLVLK